MSQQALSLKMSPDFHAQDVLFLKSVGSMARKHRISKNLSIEDISAMSGLTNRIVSELEDGTADILLDDLSSIARSLGLSAVDLVDVPPA